MTSTSEPGWRILAPLDNSLHAQRALAYATELARVRHGHIKLIRAGDPEADTGSNSLAHTAERLQQANVSVDWTVVDSNNAVSAILDAAQLWPADVIVMATSKRTAFDRWLNDSVTDAVIRSAHVPVLVVPPEWDRPLRPGEPVRVLVPLDGSSLAEQVLPVLLRLADAAPISVVLMRAIGADEPASQGAQGYLHAVSSRLENVLGDGRVMTHAAQGAPTTAILDTAQNLQVDAIAMCTHGRSGITRALLGSTATTTLEQSRVPLLLVGPGALAEPTTAQIRLRAPVRTSDAELVGEVHRVVVDLDEHAVSSVVVLGRGPLGRDVVVPADFITRVKDGELELTLTSDQMDQLPDFIWNDYFTPPPTWTDYVPRMEGPPLIPVTERKRVGPGEQDITPGTRVVCSDGDIGTLDRIEVDQFGRLEAFWLRADGVFGTEMRIPIEWLQSTEDKSTLRVAANRADIESYLGYESRARIARPRSFSNI